MVDPLNPVYKLPTPNEISIENGKPFVRDTLNVNDINQKRRALLGNRGKEILREPIEGSRPAHLHKEIKGHSYLDVKDINRDGIFESKRITNPLAPSYTWRDQDDKSVNPNYGEIVGTTPKQIHPLEVSQTRPLNLSLNIQDIEGTKSNSFAEKTYFIDVNHLLI